MGPERFRIVARAFEVRHVLARAVFEVGEAEGGLIVELGDLRHEHHVGIAVGAQPTDRPVAAGARDHFIIMIGIALDPADHRRHLLPAFRDDRVDQFTTIFRIEMRIEAGIAAPDPHL